MPDQSWACLACQSNNPPDAEVCRDCGALAAIPPAAGAGASAPPSAGEARVGQEPARSELPLSGEETGQAAEAFFASRKSHLAKARVGFWVGLALALLMAITSNYPSWSNMAIVVSFLLLFALPIARHLREQLRFGEALVTLTDETIEAPILNGKEKRLRWADVETISLDANHGSLLLTFHLRATEGVRDIRRSWTGINPAKPSMGLLAFSETDQEAILDAVRRRHRRASNGVEAGEGTSCDNSCQPNELRERRELQERIRALQPNTWMTHALIGVNVLIWLAILFDGGEIARTPADQLLVLGGNAASEVQKGEWWRLLSATFLHSGLLHLTMNVLGLYTAGKLVERIYGAPLFLLIYVGSGLIGSALSLHYAAQQTVAVGASGAVFGVVGALLVAVFQHRDKLPKAFSKQMLVGMGFFVFYSLLQGLGNSGIDNAAHVGGLLGGCLAAFILPERFDLDHFRRTFARRAVAALAVLGLTTVSIAALAPLAAIDQAAIIASTPSLQRAFQGFENALKSVHRDQDDVKAGKLSELEADERSRSVHAPIFRSVTDDLAKVVLRPGDPRESLVREIRRVSELLTESLAMASVFDQASGKLEPADPTRMAEIERELLVLGERLNSANQSAGQKP